VRKKEVITPVKVELLKVDKVKPKVKEDSNNGLQYRELCYDKSQQQGDYKDSYLKKRQAKAEKYEPPKAAVSFVKQTQVTVPLKPKD
jgi:hypothetical protein